MRHVVSLCALLVFAGSVASCTDSSGKSADTGAAEPEDDAAEPAEQAGDDAGEEDAEVGEPSRDAAAADGGSDPVEQVALPEGSREQAGILNLVDEQAAAQLEEMIASQRLAHPTQRHSLTEATNMFLRIYPEEYDFLFFFTDHPIPTSGQIAVFETVNGPAVPGGGYEFELRAEGYQSDGRLLGVIGVQHRPGVYPPLAHETLHYWANHLDPRFGFGAGMMNVGAHWGYSSVNGQLGGFDGDSLRCAAPAGARPPSCTAQPDGRIRYVVDSFFPNDNTARPYAALELYLMGLKPADQVPQTFQVLEQAAEVEGGRDPDAGTVLLEAAGIKQQSFDEIVTRHGTKPMRSDAERHLRAAFVVVSAQPASEQVLTEVARWAAVFGSRTDVAGLSSFETLTGGLASMDTSLGARRSVASSPPAPRGALSCDVLLQDCPRPELGCYLGSAPLCALSGKVALDEPCDAIYACAPGLDCVSGKNQPTRYVCKPYCDAADDTSAQACRKLCPGTYLKLESGGMPLGALCVPP